MVKFRQLAKEWIPPIVIASLRELRGSSTYGFSGDYQAWKDALANSTGYDDPRIIERVDAATQQVRSGAAAYERDSVLFDRIQYAWPVLAGLLRAASSHNGDLRVLDFGGALGTSYYQNKDFLSVIPTIRWCVVDQPSFVAIGREKYQNSSLAFYDTIHECMDHENFNVILLSGVLQYVEDPHALLGDILGLGVGTVIVDRTPFIEGADRDRLTVQKVPPSIYPASYPHWFFEHARFLRHFSDQGYRIVADFEGFDTASIKNSFYRGYIFSRTGSPPKSP